MEIQPSTAATPPPGVTPPASPGGREGFLSDVIVELGFATRETVDQAVRAARSPGTTVARVLVDTHAITEEQLARAIAERYGIDYIDLDNFGVDPAAANLIKPGAAKRYRAVPVAFLEGDLLVALADPADAVGIDDITVLADGLQVRPAVASAPALERLLASLPLDGAAPAPAAAEGPELRGELDALKRQLASAEDQLLGGEGHAAAAGDGPQVLDLQARLADAEAELEEARARLREAKEVSAELETLREALAAAEAGLRARADDGGLKVPEPAQAGRAEPKALEFALRRVRAELEVRTGELESLRTKLTDREIELVRARAEADSRRSELEAMRKRAESAEAEVEEALRALADAERTDGARHALAEVEGSAFAAERAFEELRRAQARMRDALHTLAEPRGPTAAESSDTAARTP